MKRTFLLFLLISTTVFANAQFNTYKKNYDAKTYSFTKGDPYQPALAGALSLIPGVGQVYAGEPFRGLSFIGGMSASLLLTGVGFMFAFAENGIGAPMMVVGALSFVGIYVWNIFDAVHVAKINNMAYRDGLISASIKPVIFKNSIGGSNQHSAGLALTLSF